MANRELRDLYNTRSVERRFMNTSCAACSSSQRLVDEAYLYVVMRRNQYLVQLVAIQWSKWRVYLKRLFVPFAKPVDRAQEEKCQSTRLSPMLSPSGFPEHTTRCVVLCCMNPTTNPPRVLHVRRIADVR